MVERLTDLPVNILLSLEMNTLTFKSRVSITKQDYSYKIDIRV
jgi:hypothetical protein